MFDKNPNPGISPGSETASRIALRRSLDMKEEFDQLLVTEEQGKIIFLRMADTSRKCDCYVGTSLHEGDPNCSKCNGKGHPYVDYQTRGRKTLAFGPPQGMQKLSEVGFSAAGDVVWYLGSDPKVAEADQIVEVQLNESTGLPVVAHKIEKLWDVAFVHELEGPNGKVQFQQVYCRQARVA